jgi:hypothetical protein
VLLDTHRFDEALAVGARVIAMDEATSGSEHIGLATAHNVQGFALAQLDRHVEAIAHFRAALHIGELHGDPRRIAIYRENLGFSTGRAGDAAGGIAMLRLALAAFAAGAEPDFGEQCATLEKIAALQRASGDPAWAN